MHRRVQTIHLGEDLVGGSGPDKGLGVVVVLGDVSIDRGLEVDDRVEAAASIRRRVSAEKKVSTALTQEPEVGVKWKIQRGWRASHLRTFGCLWAA